MTKKPKVIFISHLKPAEDIRSYLKLANSLINQDLEIHIIGPGKNQPESKKIDFHMTGAYNNSLFGRAFKIWKAFVLVIKLKPDLIIPNHTELLYVAFINKILFGTKIGYDLQENTIANAQYSVHLPPWKKTILISFYTLTERIARRWVDQYYIAETIYKQQLKLPSGKSVTVLNTYKPIDGMDQNREDLGRYRLLFCGTIARVYGIFEAIELTKQLHHINETYSLIINGFTSDKKILNELRNRIKDLPFIQLKTDSFPIPYTVIHTEMLQSGMVLMPYQNNPAIEGRIPTKWYECRALKIPMMIAENDFLKSLPLSDDAAIFHPFNGSNIRALDTTIQSKTFYSKPIPEDVFWARHGERFATSVCQLLGK